MTNSIRRARKFSRSGVAAASAVSLALGAFSVVGPGPLASAEESLTGGIRSKGSGVINAGDQLESDLDAGSCMVQPAPGSQDGSQGGFSWITVEPSNNTTDKRTWGVSVAFDNSKDRTFAYWEWSSSSRNGTPVTFGSVPAADAGESLLPGVTASDKADEELGIFRGPQITYGLQSVLTEDEVKKFAQAGADSPVRYVWKTQYTQDNATGIKATDNSTFVALVNPWPSENNECNPITVDWVGIQEHVIVPGEEIKVGHIDVPALSDGSVDEASLSRMVVEAYDGNGKYIASSDTSASGGGEQLLRVDDNGDIYYTWPEYRGTDLAADKNVQFSVVAKPRTTSQLEAAYASDVFYGPYAKTFDSSNSLPRYNTSNEIGRNTISLDDTEYHDPQYNTDEQTITSGIDSNGNLTNQPQKVVFKQVPDLIADLVKDKGAGGFNAKVELDERYVFAGWTAEMDPDTYDVTVTAPGEPKPGTFAQPKVVVEYSNGSNDVLSLLVIVDPNHTQITDLKRPAVAKGEVNKEITSQITTKSIMNGYDPIAPATYEVDQSTVPEGWTVTVDNTGKVTATADDTVAPGTIISPKVTATYPDGTDDPVEVQFQAIVDIKIPGYDTVTNKPNSDVTLTPAIPERGLSGNTTDEAPNRYTFKDEKTELTIEDNAGTWTVKIDEATGEITTTIPRTAPEGHILEIPVVAYYSDEKPQQVKGTVVVLKGDVAPNYEVKSTGPNKAVKHEIQDVPKGSTYSFGKNPDGSSITEMTTEDGWKYTIDPKTGVVTSTPPAGSKPGDKKTITVDVVTPTNDTPKVPVTTVVQLTDSWEAEPNYPEETVYPGETVTSPLAIQKPEGVEVAKKNPYVIQPAEGYKATGDNNQFGNPTYTVTTKNGDWIVGLDDNGNVVASAPETAKPGDAINVPVKVTYSDGSTDDVTAPITVEDNPKRPVPFDVEYKYDPKVPAGEYRVETEGKPGEEKRNQDGKWEKTTAPTNEVVIIGTMPAENTQDLEWTVPIPYSTTLRENKALAPGEIKVVQEGVYGERNYTAKFRSVGDESYVVTSEDAKEPVEEIIEYGPGIQDQTLTSTTTNPVPFNTTFVADPNLTAGEQVVDKQGVNGVDTVTSTQEIKDGKPVGEPTITTERTKEPVDAVVRVGTKTEGQTVNTYEAPIPFPVRVVYDPNLAPGESKVTQEGKPGTKKVTITQPVVNSAPNGKATVAEETVTEPTEQIVTVGTKPDEATNTATWTVDVPFKTVVRPNTDLKPGEVKTVQEGEYGEKTFTADFSSVGSDSKVDTKEEQTKAPKEQIIEYGPTIDDQTLTSETTRPVEFETEFIFDDTLPAGEQKVDRQGENGEEKITSTQSIKDGKPVGEPTISTEVTKPAKNAVIRVGTKPTTTTATATATTTEKSTATETTRVEVPTTITTTLTSTDKVPTTVSGTPTTITETKEVPTTITTQVPTTIPTTVKETQFQTSTVTPAPVTTTVTNDPEPVNVSETVTLPYTTKIVFDPSLEPGQEVEKVAGVNGEVKVSFVDGKASAETVKEPVQRVVRVGSKPDATTEWTEETPFEVQVVVDPDLEAGKYETVHEGKPGQIVHRTDGSEDITPAVDHIIKVGTKKVITNPFEFSTLQPFSTTVRPNFDLKPGERKVIQEGVNGVVRYRIDMTTGEVAKLDESQAVDRIVEYGPSKADDAAVTKVTRPVPFDTKIIEDPNLPEGTQAFEQGEVGEEIVTTTQPIKDGKPYGDPVTATEQTKAPRNAIIRVGTKTPATPQPLPEFSETVELPHTTKIVWDPALEPGQEIEDVAGANGLVEARVADGKLTLETVKEPVQRVVRVGSKPADGAEWTEQIPFQVQVRQNPELNRGESRVVQNGVAGLKRYVDGVGEVVSEPVDYIFEIGTKDLTEQPTYSAVALRAGQSAEVALSTGHVKGNAYRQLDWPEGWEGSVDPETGQIRVTPPADAKPGTKVSLPVEVTDANGNTFTVSAEVAVFDNGAVTPIPTQPAEDDAEEDKGSSDKARRCLANAFAANSPFLWLLPLGILGAVGYGVNEAFGPQIQQISAQFDEAVRRNLPDFGVGHGVEKPEFVREIEGQINAINQRFAPVAQQLEPVGIALGAIALLSVTGVLVAQACSEDGFDNGLSVLGSSQDGADQQKAATSSRK